MLELQAACCIARAAWPPLSCARSPACVHKCRPSSPALSTLSLSLPLPSPALSSRHNATASSSMAVERSFQPAVAAPTDGLRPSFVGARLGPAAPPLLLPSSFPERPLAVVASPRKPLPPVPPAHAASKPQATPGQAAVVRRRARSRDSRSRQRSSLCHHRVLPCHAAPPATVSALPPTRAGSGRAEVTFGCVQVPRTSPAHPPPPTSLLRPATASPACSSAFNSDQGPRAQMNSADKDLFVVNLLNLWKFIVIHRKFVK